MGLISTELQNESYELGVIGCKETWEYARIYAKPSEEKREICVIFKLSFTVSLESGLITY